MISHVPYVKAGHAVFTPSCPRICPWDNLVQRPRPPRSACVYSRPPRMCFPGIGFCECQNPICSFATSAPHHTPQPRTSPQSTSTLPLKCTGMPFVSAEWLLGAECSGVHSRSSPRPAAGGVEGCGLCGVDQCDGCRLVSHLSFVLPWPGIRPSSHL